MATNTITIGGKFEVAIQNGTATGASGRAIAHKLIGTHTGRHPFEKIARAYIKNDNTKFADERLIVEGAPIMAESPTTVYNLAYDSSGFDVAVNTNAAKLSVQIDAPDMNIQLADSSEYTKASSMTSTKVTPTDTRFGIERTGTLNLSFATGQNNGSTALSGTIYIYTLDDDDNSGDREPIVVQVSQASSDSGITITLSASIINHGNAEQTSSITVTSTGNYKIVNTSSWVTITPNNTSYPAGTQTLQIKTSAQAVAAPTRSYQLSFVNPISGSVLKTLEIKQAAGDAYSVSWAKESLTFKYNASVSQDNTLIANADWEINEPNI